MCDVHDLMEQSRPPISYQEAVADRRQGPARLSGALSSPGDGLGVPVTERMDATTFVRRPPQNGTRR
jgi:hypothetical protein